MQTKNITSADLDSVLKDYSPTDRFLLKIFFDTYEKTPNGWIKKSEDMKENERTRIDAISKQNR